MTDISGGHKYLCTHSSFRIIFPPRMYSPKWNNLVFIVIFFFTPVKYCQIPLQKASFYSARSLILHNIFFKYILTSATGWLDFTFQFTSPGHVLSPQMHSLFGLLPKQVAHSQYILETQLSLWSIPHSISSSYWFSLHLHYALLCLHFTFLCNWVCPLGVDDFPYHFNKQVKWSPRKGSSFPHL